MALLAPETVTTPTPEQGESYYSLNQWAPGAAPTVNDDETAGFTAGSFWFYSGSLYVCTDPTATAAVWNEIRADEIAVDTTAVTGGTAGYLLYHKIGDLVGEIPADLADPNADRIAFWDDSAGKLTWLALGTNLSITGTTLDAAAGGGMTIGNAVAGGGANRVLYEDGSQNLAASSAFTFDGTYTFGLPNSHAMRFPNNTTVFIGNQAGDSFVAGSSNIGIGFAALSGALNSGNQNIGIGTQAGHQITTGSNNVCLGVNAGYSIVSGSSNMYIGYQCGLYNTGDNNIAVGVSTLQGSSGLSTGTENVGIGGSSLLSVQSGTSNVGIGYVALQSVTSGNQNVAIGRQAGFSVVTGSANLFLGYQAGYNETGSNKLYIENSTSTTPLIYGEFDNDLVRIYGMLYIRKTSEQIRAEYDASNYFSTTVSSTGGVTFDAVGSGAGFTFSDDVTLADAKNLIFNTTTGTKIGTATTQKLGFFNATPIARPASAGAITDSIGGGSAGGTITSVTGADTVDLNKLEDVLSTLALTINDIRSKLVDLGLIS